MHVVDSRPPLTFRRSYTSHSRHCRKRIAADSTKIPLRTADDPGRVDGAVTPSHHRLWPPPRRQRSPNTRPTTPPSATQQWRSLSTCPSEHWLPAGTLEIAPRPLKNYDGLQSFPFRCPNRRNHPKKSLRTRNRLAGVTASCNAVRHDDPARAIAFLIREKISSFFSLAGRCVQTGE